MVDQTSRSPDQTREDFSQDSADSTGYVSGAAKSVAEQALAAGRELKDKAFDVAGASSEAVKNQASDFLDAAKEAAKDAASQATGRLKETAEAQKGAGAQYVGNFAETIRRAAGEFDNELPLAADYIRKAATSIDGISEQIKNGNLNDLVRGAQSFARRQPSAFLGIAVLAGFGIIRFLKSSADSAGSDASSSPRQASNSNDRGSPNEHAY